MRSFGTTPRLGMEVGKFVIELDSPCSTAPSTPTSKPSHMESDYFHQQPSPPPKPTRLEELIDSYRTSFENDLSEHTQHKRERTILDHLHYNPVTLRDVEVLVPEFNVRPFTLMNKLATNIGLFHSRGDITDPDLEEIYIYLIAQGTRGANAIFEKARSKVERFKEEARQYEEHKKKKALRWEASKSNAGRKAFKYAQRNTSTESTEGEHTSSADSIDDFSQTTPETCALFPIPSGPAKPVISLREQGYADIPVDPPTAAQLSTHDNVEKKDRFWAKTRSIPQWIPQQKTTAKAVIRLPPTIDSPARAKKAVPPAEPEVPLCTCRVVVARPKEWRAVSSQVVLPLTLSSYLPR